MIPTCTILNLHLPELCHLGEKTVLTAVEILEYI